MAMRMGLAAWLYGFACLGAFLTVVSSELAELVQGQAGRFWLDWLYGDLVSSAIVAVPYAAMVAVLSLGLTRAVTTPKRAAWFGLIVGALSKGFLMRPPVWLRPYCFPAQPADWVCTAAHFIVAPVLGYFVAALAVVALLAVFTTRPR